MAANGEETKSYKGLDQFLYEHRVKPGEKCDRSEITHTRIGHKNADGEWEVYGGRYIIPSEKTDEFYKLYYNHVALSGNKEYLTEVQLRDGSGPILIDLDFRYDTDVTERQHDKSHVRKIADVYANNIGKLFNFNDSDDFYMYVLEKPSANCLEDKTKDGIHMIVTVQADHIQQKILREMVMPELAEALSDLPFTNTIEDVVDESIVKGGTPWQLYMSRKPKHEAYALTSVYQYHFDEEDETFSEPRSIKTTAKRFNTSKVMRLLSARNNTHKKFDMNAKYKEAYDEMSSTASSNAGVFTINSSLPPERQFVESVTRASITSIADIEDAATAVIDGLQFSESFIKETYDYAMKLPEEYYTSYAKWIQVLWGMRNTDIRLFWPFVHFSSQWEDFTLEEVSKISDMWTSGDCIDKGLTYRSIQYWLKESKPDDYYALRSSSIEQIIDKSVEKTWGDAGHTDIAQLIYQMFSHKYRCVSQKKNLWYALQNNRWVESEGGRHLHGDITATIQPAFDKRIIYYMKLLHDSTDEKEAEKLNKKIDNLGKIFQRLSDSNYKQKVVHEMGILSMNEYPDFLEKMDTNPNLLGFNNGVFDFGFNPDTCKYEESKMGFRETRPTDNISFTCGYDYVDIDMENEEHVKAVKFFEDFMEKIFPIPSVRKYVWQLLAYSIVGQNMYQMYNFFIGSGSNGKSILQTLCSEAFGDYFKVFDIANLTKDRSEGSKPNTALIELKGKRIVFSNEASEGKAINEGIMKEYTGGDTLSVRNLYDNKMTSFKPQFTMICATNNLPVIKAKDDGTWRRIKVIPLITKFDDNVEEKSRELGIDPEDTSEDRLRVYAKDPTVEPFAKKHAPIFMSMLTAMFVKYKGKIEENKYVLAASLEYQNKQDIIKQFYMECIEPADERSSFGQSDVRERFSEWYTDNVNDKNKPRPSVVYEFISKRVKPVKRRWYGYRIIHRDEDVAEAHTEVESDGSDSDDSGSESD